MAVWPFLQAEASAASPHLFSVVMSSPGRDEADDLEVPRVRGGVHGGLLVRVGPILLIHYQEEPTHSGATIFADHCI